ncbi:CoA-binding protein [Saccharopolyspora sp. CA-218241]|uniref:CoA-binding protein n=1 Tax=Saccharopolyspora sp. CA-218241 TaxID=3240027 RepID=UPI003D976045
MGLDGVPDPPPRARNLRRLLSPRHIAVVGGDAAAEVVRQCRRLGFTGAIRPVHPSRSEIEGLPCHRSVAELPEVPDAAFVAVPARPPSRSCGSWRSSAPEERCATPPVSPSTARTAQSCSGAWWPPPGTWR